MTTRELIENKHFENEAVPVDGVQFKNCAFTRASLVYGGGVLPSFVDCQFNGVALDFSGPAANTLQFLSGLRRGGFAPAIDKIVDGVRRQQL